MNTKTNTFQLIDFSTDKQLHRVVLIVSARGLILEGKVHIWNNLHGEWDSMEFDSAWIGSSYIGYACSIMSCNYTRQYNILATFTE